jgi:hypothetical protein
MSPGRPIALVVLAALLSGCVYAYHSTAVAPRFATEQRPDPSYFCYDCHGYRFFDPYYDWCPPYGFAYRWDRPRMQRIYRERYVALKRQDRRLGRFEYPEGYRSTRRYREPRDYMSWREGREDRDDRPALREQRGKERGTKSKRSRDREGQPSRKRGREL